MGFYPHPDEFKKWLIMKQQMKKKEFVLSLCGGSFTTTTKTTMEHPLILNWGSLKAKVHRRFVANLLRCCRLWQTDNDSLGRVLCCWPPLVIQATRLELTRSPVSLLNKKTRPWKTEKNGQRTGNDLPRRWTSMSTVQCVNLLRTLFFAPFLSCCYYL